MLAHNKLIECDLKHIWHPATYMKDLETYPPLIVRKARGSYLYTERGVIIDAISSWWCKSLGHGHPAILAAIKKQMQHFEHIIGADTTYPALAELGVQLAEISGLQHVFFASDGSSAVEIALKLAIYATQLKSNNARTQFVALKNSYHGESLAALSLSDLGIYKDPFANFGLKCHFLKHIPYLNSTAESLWQNCDANWQLTLQELETIKTQICAIIVEPIIQGAGGMRCYSADFLHKLSHWARLNQIYLIADEIMTGMGRTGKWLASHHANISPDMICLSKGLTAGTIPMSCVLITDEIYKLFYHDASIGTSFLHSHTYSGNPLAVSAALATINTIRREGINQQAAELGACMHKYFTELAIQTGKISNVRSIGAMVAGDLLECSSRRIGYQLRQEAIARGALLRPIGNTLYWLPPLNTKHETIERLAEISYAAITAVYV